MAAANEDSPYARILRYGLSSLSLAVAGGLGTLARNRFQRQTVFVPERYPNGIWDPAPFGVPAEDVWFSSEDSVELHGWWIPHAKALGTVLYCHGNTGNISTRIGVFRHMRRMRLNIFAFDYRGYGRSAGEPSEAGLFRDVRAAHDQLAGPLGIAVDSILLFGHSLGGAVAIDVALQRPVAGLVVQSAFTHVRDMARVLFPTVPLHLLTRNQFRNIDKIGRLEMPKLFIHGTNDETVPIALGQKLFERAAEPKEWYAVANAGHNDIYRWGGFRYLWRLVRFRDRCLKR